MKFFYLQLIADFRYHSTYSPVWNETFVLQIGEPAAPGELCFNLFDWNRMEAHELVGHASLNAIDLRALAEQPTGFVSRLNLPVFNANKEVVGHDNHKSLLNVALLVKHGIPRPAQASPAPTGHSIRKPPAPAQPPR